MSKIVKTPRPHPVQGGGNQYVVHKSSQLIKDAHSLFQVKEGSRKSKTSWDSLVGQNKTELASIISTFLCVWVFRCYFFLA